MAAGNDIEEMMQMHRMRRRLVVGLTVIAAFAFSGLALAAEGDDTVLNYGYDEDSHFFMWNVTSLDYDPDSEELESTLQEYEEGQLQALLTACGLEGDSEDPTEYSYTYDPATGLITVTPVESPEASEEGPEGESDAEEIVCGEFNGGDVTGPAGQVNHGMFLKFFNENYEGENRGCIVSQIARSGLGMGDQQVNAGGPDSEVAESEDSTEDSEEVVEGSITFTTVTTNCQHGNGEDEGEEAEDDGPPQHVLDMFDGQHPRDAKGKPATTPGGP